MAKASLRCKTQINCSDYLHNSFCPRCYRITKNRIIKQLKGIKFDSVVFTGVSGAAFGFTIANALNKRPVCVRKPGASTHSSNDTEGGLCAGVDEHYSNINFGKCVILDDFISEGGTIERLTNVVGAKNVVAIVLYYKGNVTGSYTTKKMRMIPVINACKMDKVSAAFSKKIKKVSGMGKKMAEETRILAKKNKRPLCISADEI